MQPTISHSNKNAISKTGVHRMSQIIIWRPIICMPCIK